MGVGGGGVASFPVVGSPNMSVIEDSSRVTVESLEEVCEEEAAVAVPIESLVIQEGIGDSGDRGLSGNGELGWLGNEGNSLILKDSYI